MKNKYNKMKIKETIRKVLKEEKLNNKYMFEDAEKEGKKPSKDIWRTKKDQNNDKLNEMDDDIEKYNPDGLVDKLGAFFVVTKPKTLSKNTKIIDIVFKSTIFYLFNQLDGGLPKEEIVGIFKSKSEANKLGNEILKSFNKGIKEAETEAKQYKALQASLKEKLRALKEKKK